MEDFAPSRTALGVSLLRAEHARNDPDPVIADPWGDRLVPAWARDHYRQIALDRMTPEARTRAAARPEAILGDFFGGQALYGNILLRARWSEDALAAAAAEGTAQYVILGAGFDSFFLRRPPFARDLTVIEVDHPATQALKRGQLAALGIAIPPNTALVAADLASEDLASALARSPFRGNRPAFFSWLGVTIYLTREANLATLRAIAAASAPGSRLAFSYADSALFRPALAAAPETATLSSSFKMVAAMGEPWVSGFDPALLADELADVGFDLIEDLNGPELAARYGRVGARALPVTASSRFALASVRV